MNMIEISDAQDSRTRDAQGASGARRAGRGRRSLACALLATASIASACASQSNNRLSGGDGGATGAGAGGGPGGADAGAGVSAVSGLPTPPGPGGVAKPSGGTDNLTILNWAGWTAAVSYTFDDANSSQIANYPALQALGVHMTFYLITGKPEAASPVWAQAILDGHELGNHTQSHVMAGTGADIDAATDFLKQTFGVTAWTMAAPYGDASYTPLASTRFLINRGVSNGLMAPNDSTDPFSLFCYIPPQESLAAAFNDQIDATRAAGKWRVVLVHGFTNSTNDGAYQPVSITEFTDSVAHSKSLGDVWIDSVVNVGAYWRAQKTLTAVTPTMSSAGNKTWTWTLPDHFPPGHFLRVKVDGGTLMQAGVALTWDDHGYYEVALDAGSLTWTP